ncbi:NAD(P)/FAD-dependent oxidoreductase [Cerasicoccus arenae]|uniref:FAD-dependent oxidoreductase n=1 Tax=Cerasicoccus arenae TaxID=424488 RepID=A0A8J3DAE8_9BACT|nr:FAD-dependent monooxygenase [Cerasicoccus arenae]MBK1859490.1 FAD-dependent monooxygenase [Cerasicoccus arenae]GHB94942.1 FAD-dependent oxidoreductase [Cerasicoccus arenae]
MTNVIQIVGGGLAGLALGIGLRERGVSVVVHEAHNYPRHRVCGEFIAGLTDETQDLLGIRDSLSDAQLLTRSIWRLGDRVVYEQQLPRPALGISRYSLDARLAERFVALGGDLRIGARLGPTEDLPGWVWSQGRERCESEWIGLKMHCQQLDLDSELELHLGAQAYVGLAPVEGGRVNVCGLFRQRPVAATSRVDRLPAYLDACGLGTLAVRVRGGQPDSVSAVGVTALSYEPSQPDGCVRLGDQSGLIAPFTGNGMAQALEGAALALEPLTRFAEGQGGWQQTAAEINERLQKSFRHRRAIARWLHPWLLSPPKQNLLAVLARARLLPFDVLFRLTH